MAILNAPIGFVPGAFRKGKGHLLISGSFSSVAIAGGWGYIGRKFLDAARQLDCQVSVFDPGRPPRTLDLRRVSVWDDELAFYQQPVDLFHLALQPEHRAAGIDSLLQSTRTDVPWILCEKPMAAPDNPDDVAGMVAAVERSAAVVLYDFPELFDPITHRILEYLRAFKNVRIESIYLQRSKDREDPDIARNNKRMVPIEYQESVHCLAFALYLLSQLHGGRESLFSDGLSVDGRAEPYLPPNPQDYPYVVDGRCEYRCRLGHTSVHGLTDFKRHAPWAKRREVKGTVDGRGFLIEADYLEGHKRLTIDGERQDDVVDSNSYVNVLETIRKLREQGSRTELRTEKYPGVSFAQMTYQLSSLLWRSSWERQAIELASADDLLTFDAGFAEAAKQFDRY